MVLMITLSILKRATPEILNDLNALMDQMSQSGHSKHRLDLAGLRAALRNPALTVFVLKDRGCIVGTGSLVLFHSLIGVRARLEEVVVHEGYRGRGLGKRLSKTLLALARRKKAASIEFTSRPSRTAAVALYEKLGFKRHETNVYRLALR